MTNLPLFLPWGRAQHSVINENNTSHPLRNNPHLNGENTPSARMMPNFFALQHKKSETLGQEPRVFNELFLSG